MTGLVLAGTNEARLICRYLFENHIQAVASIAGVTRNPNKLAIKTRVGGFGGVDGFKKYIIDNDIGWVVSASHPFASVMRATASKVCTEFDIPHLIFQRPEWDAKENDDWYFIDEIKQLDNLIPIGSTVFLGTGRQVLSEYFNMAGRKLLCRVIDEPTNNFPFEGGSYLVGRPPFSVQEEVALFKKYKINWLVVKNSGGSGGFSKILAARELGLPVAMLNRPKLPNGTISTNIKETLDWLKGKE